jgi:hypothetical protein
LLSIEFSQEAAHQNLYQEKSNAGLTGSTFAGVFTFVLVFLLTDA